MHYALRCSISAHTNDVRALATFENCIISGSRDMTAKIWTETGTTYEDVASMRCHSKYISAVCGVPPCEKFLGGLIFTGSHDNSIFGYIPYDTEPTCSLEGHSGPVCCLTPGGNPGQLISSSWDATAKLWDIASAKCITTYMGHTQTVWCVISMPGKLVVTGSGDKCIKVYQEDGILQKTLFGHRDCVRGLTSIGQEIFLSCANDGSVRKWNIISGDCLEEINCRDHHIYTISARSSLIAIGGEGNQLTILFGGKKDQEKERQEIVLPATSIWAVTILPNLDIVTGTSDGHIRIFTQDPSRMASEEKVAEFEKEFMKKNDINGTVNPSGLPGKEVLAINGNFDGEIKFVHDNGTNYAYSWNHQTRSWSILGKECGKKPSKPIYEGQEYDYVFSVDIADNQEPLKLPFNKGDDCVLVAQKFIVKNNLSLNFLDRIIRFLEENTAKDEPNVPHSSSMNSGRVFQKYYPLSKHVTFSSHDLKLICKKLQDFMNTMRVPEKESDQIMTCLKSLAANEVGSDPSASTDILIRCLVDWPEEFVYPILDITRIAVLGPNVHPLLLSDTVASRVLSALERFMKPDALKNNKMFLFRILSNMFSHQEGESFIFSNKEVLLLVSLPDLITGSHVGLQIGVATFILNMSLTAVNKKDSEAAQLCLTFIKKICSFINDPEATFRLLVAIGTLGSFEGESIITGEILNLLRQVSSWKKDDGTNQKSVQCAENILKDFGPKSV